MATETKTPAKEDAGTAAIANARNMVRSEPKVRMTRSPVFVRSRTRGDAAVSGVEELNWGMSEMLR